MNYYPVEQKLNRAHAQMHGNYFINPDALTPYIGKFTFITLRDIHGQPQKVYAFIYAQYIDPVNPQISTVAFIDLDRRPFRLTSISSGDIITITDAFAYK
ncbi:hypothetical protein ACN6A9_19820 [Bacillus safensis]